MSYRLVMRTLTETPWSISVGAAIASGIFTAKLTKKLPNTIAQYALTAGVSSESVDAVVSAVAASNGVSVSVPGGWRVDYKVLFLRREADAPLISLGITDAQMMAAQLGRLNAYAKSFAYIFWSVLPWAVVGAIGGWRTANPSFSFLSINAHSVNSTRVPGIGS